VESSGHVIRVDGLKLNPDHIEAVKKFKSPHDISTVELASWYRQFVPNFTKIAGSHEMTKKNHF